MKILLAIIFLLLAIVLSKFIWVFIMTYMIGSFDSEKDDILERAEFLLNETCTTPEEIINKMPSCIGRHFQGEWAIYTLSMTSIALANIATLYPETKRWISKGIEGMIRTAMSDEIREYDTRSWGDTFEGHLSYYSLLALMISAYRATTEDDRFRLLYANLCDNLYKQISNSKNMNIPTYPGQQIYVPDMAAAIAALANYPSHFYKSFAKDWVTYMKNNYIDPETGLLVSTIDNYSQPVLGSYSSLTTYYLTFIDEEFAREQYQLLKKHFLKTGLFTGIKERTDGSSNDIISIDSGPIIFGLSPSGTAFGIGPATFFEDWNTRNKMLKTGEWAGFTVTKNHRHYLLSDVALVGEAIVLAMRTATKWNEHS